MDQEGVIRVDAPHEVKMADGAHSATSVRAVPAFGEGRRVVPSARRVKAPWSGVQWAEIEEAVVAPAQQGWVVRPARVTHMGKPPEARVDFRGALKALRAKNVEVRERLNRLMAPVQQVMK